MSYSCSDTRSIGCSFIICKLQFVFGNGNRIVIGYLKRPFKVRLATVLIRINIAVQAGAGIGGKIFCIIVLVCSIEGIEFVNRGRFVCKGESSILGQSIPIAQTCYILSFSCLKLNAIYRASICQVDINRNYLEVLSFCIFIFFRQLDTLCCIFRGYVHVITGFNVTQAIVLRSTFADTCKRVGESSLQICQGSVKFACFCCGGKNVFGINYCLIQGNGTCS